MNEAGLHADLLAAMRARDMQRVYVLRGLVTVIKNLKVEKQADELPEPELLGLVRKEINKRIEARSYAEKAGRSDLVEQNTAEQHILEAYLPGQLDEAALESTIQALSLELGTAQIGPLMAEMRKRYPGQFDGKLASEIIRKLGPVASR